jgi:hypothetical protein
MKEIKIKYSTVSPRRQELRDRLQLIGASISIIIGYSETLNIYAGITIILPIIGFVIAFINILFVRFYKNLVQKYGDQFELVLMRTNGIIMLITGIGFQIAGSKYIQYAYYLLTILFFIILPYFILPAKKKKLVLIFTPSELIVHKRLRAIKSAWQHIDRIWIHKGVIKIKQKGHNKIKQFFFEATTEKQTTIYGFIENIKFEKGYGFEIQKIG